MSVAPSYGGDEVSALVLDPGTYSTRIGFAGEDTPKCVLPTSFGTANRDSGLGEENGLKASSRTLRTSRGKKLFIGDLQLHIPSPGKEIHSPMAGGLIEDFEGALQTWKHGFEDALRVDVREHPLLVTEAGWNETKRREKTMQVLFEELEVPATYLARNGVCAAFAAGKATALVVDVGAGACSITPVVDGLVLKKGIYHSSIAGDAVSHATRDLLQRMGITINPSYRVSRKVQVDPGAPAQATLREIAGISSSFHAYQEEKVILEWKESCCAILERPYDENLANTRQPKSFEFPDGYNLAFGSERYKVGETLFNPKLLGNSDASSNALSLSQLLHSSISSVDPDIRAHLLNNVVLTGGSSLIPGLGDRLTNEIQTIAPGSKVRIYAPGNTVERKCGGWLGGSILSSLGTFHQMWVSKAEYNEVGANIVEKRCR